MPVRLLAISAEQDVAADGPDDVFYKFRTVGFGTFLLLCGIDTFIGNRFTAMLIFFDTGIHIY